jgi:lysophospholipase L1-like esterase
MDTPAAFLEPDGVHLNPAGYAVWARVLRESLDAASVPDRSCAG